MAQQDGFLALRDAAEYRRTSWPCSLNCAAKAVVLLSTYFLYILVDLQTVLEDQRQTCQEGVRQGLIEVRAAVPG